MPFPLNIAILGAEDTAAKEFYAAVLTPTVQDYGGFARMQLHGTGDLGVTGVSELAAEAGALPGELRIRPARAQP